jgi:fucose permease
MSRLIARILLAILMFPLAAILHLIVYIMTWDLGQDPMSIVVSLLATSVFVGAYWTLLWRGSVRWTRRRVTQTFAAVAAALALGAVVGVGVGTFERDTGTFCGGATTILFWVVLTIFSWRESPQERADRLRGAAGGIVCPNCGYNLTGLTSTRCPECGTPFTLDELLANQPARATAEIESA